METSRYARQSACGPLARLACALLLGALFGPAVAAGPEPERFDTPQAAAQALIESLGKDGADAMLDIFGREYEKELLGGDEVAARVARERAHAAAMKMYRLRVDGDDRRTLIIGPHAWPVPFPIVKAGDGWHFDTAAGIEELVNRRIGRNELNAISVVRTFIAAQEQYASVDRDGDGVREYAQLLASNPGKRDGLYWEVAEGSDDEISPFGPLVADARDYLDGRDPGDPYQGYYFKVISRQGENAPGGRYDYVINGNMIAGFAMIAYPAEHGVSGIMSFLVSHLGRIYEKDLGEDSFIRGASMETYNPDDSWELLGD